MEGLTQGRIVHYVENELWHRSSDIACIVTEIDDTDYLEQGRVYLTAFRTGKKPKAIKEPVPYSETRRTGTWHWIERA